MMASAPTDLSFAPGLGDVFGGAGGAASGISKLLGPLSIAAPIVGAAASAFQGITGFISGQQQAKQAQLAAQQASITGGINTQERLLQGMSQTGRAATLAASSGGGLGGSATGVINQIAERGMFNARAAAYRGATEADSDRYQSSVDKDNAINSLIGGAIGAAGQGVGGALKASFRNTILGSAAYKAGEIEPYSASMLAP